MQSNKHGAIREGKLPVPVCLGCYIVAQQGTYTVEVSCFMSRRDPFPVAVSVRDFGNEGRGRFPTRVSWCRSNEGDKAGQCCNCSEEQCEAFHKASSVQHA